KIIHIDMDALYASVEQHDNPEPRLLGGTEGSQTLPWRGMDSNLYGALAVKWSFLVCCGFFVRSRKAVLRPVACDQVRGARGRGQGTETVAQLGGLPP